jgi:hypothetical protein
VVAPPPLVARNLRILRNARKLATNGPCQQNKTQKDNYSNELQAVHRETKKSYLEAETHVGSVFLIFPPRRSRCQYEVMTLEIV